SMPVWSRHSPRRDGGMAGHCVKALRLARALPNCPGRGARDAMDDDALKFIVLDPEDLAVVSAHVQDAVVKVADVIWRPQEKRLVMGLNRFDWEAAQDAAPQYRRRRAALRFERVLGCKCKSVDPSGKDAVLNLLAVEFTETDAPAGFVTLIFSGGGALRLDV